MTPEELFNDYNSSLLSSILLSPAASTCTISTGSCTVSTSDSRYTCSKVENQKVENQKIEIDHYIVNESNRIDKRTGKKFGPTVVVFFKDGTNTHATLNEGDTFDLQMGIAACMLKKACGEDAFSKINKVVKNQEKRLADEKKAAEDRKNKAIARNNKNKKLDRDAYERAVKDRAKFELDVANAKKQFDKKIVD